MKMRQNLTDIALVVLALFGSLHTASAYYDPGIQRWMNRDPFMEPGFETVRNDVPVSSRRFLSPGEVLERSNLYVFIGNEHYVLSGDDLLMPSKKNQAPPDLRYFKSAPK